MPTSPRSSALSGGRGSVPVVLSATLAGLLTVTSAARGQVNTERLRSDPIAVPILQIRPSLDGAVSEEEWAGAAVFDLPYETSPAVNGPAPVGTRCYIGRDAVSLLVACVAEDPNPSRIRALYADRDRADADDRIALYLDPFGDAQRAFVFSVSALGVQTDGVFEQATGSVDNSWNTIWQSGGRLTDSGFMVEFAVPFRSLRFPDRANGPPWRFFVERLWPRDQVTTLRSTRYDPNDQCRLCWAGSLDPGVPEATAVQVEAVPTLTAMRASRRALPNEPLTSSGLEPDAGLDLRWNLSTQSALNLTVNPDFSQVEADELQLTTNTRFALFVPERRPFFLESAEAFESLLPVVFTRAIVDPVAGAKFTGRRGAWSAGALYSRDATATILVPGAFGSTIAGIEEQGDAWVGRVTRTFGSGNLLGGVLTHRMAPGYHSTMGGFDALLRPLRSLRVRGQLVASTTLDPAGLVPGDSNRVRRTTDHAAQIDARYASRNWSGHARLESIGSGFRADLGFVPQVDTRRLETSLARHFWGDGVDWLTRFEASVGSWNVYTQEGALKERGIWARTEYDGPAQLVVAVNPFWMTEGFAGQEFDRGGVNVSASIAPTERFSLFLRGRGASVVDYANVRLASELEVGAEALLRLGRRLSFALSGTRNSLNHEGVSVSREGVARLRASAAMTPHLFLTLIGQGRRVELGSPLPGSVPDIHSWSLETQGFLSYRRNGQTQVFVGYTDVNRDLTGTDGLQRQSLTWFFKVAYAWRS